MSDFFNKISKKLKLQNLTIIDSDIISKQRAIFPFFPLKNPRYKIKNKIGMVQLFASVMNGIT